LIKRLSPVGLSATIGRVALDLDVAVPDAVALLLEQDDAGVRDLDGEGDLLVRLHLCEAETADLGRSALEDEGEATLGQAAQREGPVAGDGRRDGRSLQHGDGHGPGARRAGAGRTKRARSLHGAADHDALGIRSGGISTAGDERGGGEDEDGDEGESSLAHGTSPSTFETNVAGRVIRMRVTKARRRHGCRGSPGRPDPRPT
jgi:hypothetical protein